MKKSMEFNFCVAKYWNGNEGQVGAYTMINTIFYGTLKDAKAFRKYVQKKNPEDTYKIFQLVEVPE